MIRNSFSWESYCTLPTALAKFWHDEMHIDACRLFAMGNKINPAKGVFDFTKLRHDIHALRDAGLKVHLNVYFLPKWMSNGEPTYEDYTNGCTRWRKDGNGIEFDDSKDYCVNPSNVDGDAVEALGYETGNEFGSLIDAVCVGNEWGTDIYWPPSKFADECGEKWCGHSQEDHFYSTTMDDMMCSQCYNSKPPISPDKVFHAFKRIRLGPDCARAWEQVIRPFHVGYLTAIQVPNVPRNQHRNAIFFGPEADSHGFIPKMLELTASGRPDEDYSVITIHPYGQGDRNAEILDTMRRVDEDFMPSIEADGRRKGREVWWNEYGITPCSFEGLRDLFARAAMRDVTLINFHDWKAFLEDGSVYHDTSGSTNNDGELKPGWSEYKLSTAGDFLKSARRVGKHRAVTS